jgi:L-lysine exporter family protein LysE/ArgO
LSDSGFMAAVQVAGSGFAIGGALIVAIGAQNAFVLRLGLQRLHVGPVVLFCAVADLLLIALGVAGIGRLLQHLPGLETGLTLMGAFFLLAYGLLALRRALQPGSLRAANAAAMPLRLALAQAAAFTLLNPHVYLDTVLLVGSIGAQQPAGLRPAFVAGAGLASLVWFSALGFGARWLAPWFAKPMAWRMLEGLVSATMLLLALGLALRLVR